MKTQFFTAPDVPVRNGYYEVQYWNGEIELMNWQGAWTIPAAFIMAWRGLIRE